MVKIGEKPIIEWQLDLFKKFNIEVIIVTGYKKDKIRYKNVKYFHNLKYDSTNMVETLFCAKTEMTEPTIISYGDIIFDETVLQKLLESKFDCSVVIDSNWKEYWELRFEKPLSDAESLIIDNEGYIIDIGRKTEDINQIQGQYIGLMKFQDNGLEFLKEFYQQTKETSINKKNQLNEELEFKKLYMTDLLRGMINAGTKIKAIPTHNGWLEIDTINDYNLYTKMINDDNLGLGYLVGRLSMYLGNF